MTRIIALSILFMVSCATEYPTIPTSSKQSRFPRLSSNDKDDIFVTWFEEIDSTDWSLRGSIFSNNKWSSPMTISSDQPYFINWADFPSLNYIKDDTLVAHWLEKSGAGTYDYDVHLSFSFNEGRSWSSSQIPHSSKVKGEHGFSSFGIGNNTHDLVWLDGREMNMGHSSGHYGKMNLCHTTFTSNGVLGDEFVIDNKVCECCPTASVRYKDTLVVAYRDRTNEEIRDINIARKAGDIWEKPYRVHNDNWKIAGCPVNGPMLATQKGKIAIAWYTGADNSARVNVAFSKDIGRTFSEPIRIDLSMPLGRVDLEWINNNEVIVSWIESGDETSNIYARRVNINTSLSKETLVEKIPPGRISGYPQMEVVNNNVLFAWTEINKKTIVASKWLSLSAIK
mgnify:FL=1